MAGGEPLVLIVEDNEHNRKLARDLLRFDGMRTVEARTGAEGIELARQHHPDLVLMDLRLPDIDGQAALRALRADPGTAGLVVVVVTSAAMAGDRERLLAAGFDGYLAKPIDGHRFAAQLRALLPAGNAAGAG